MRLVCSLVFWGVALASSGLATGGTADAIHEYETARVLAPDDSGMQWTVAQAFLRQGLVREAVGWRNGRSAWSRRTTICGSNSEICT